MSTHRFKASRRRAHTLFLTTLLAGLFCILAGEACFKAHGNSATSPIKHKMFLLDEPRRQLLYVDETAPEKNWKLAIEGGPAWSLQLVGNNRLLVAIPDKGGFREYDLATKKIVREKFDAKRYSGSMSVVRLPDGRTVLACEGGRGKPVRLYLFDDKDEEIATWKFPELRSLRLLRTTPKGNLLFGSNKNNLLEVTLEGKKVRSLNVPGAQYTFQISELVNGNFLVACGYAGFLTEVDKDGKSVRKLGGKPEPGGLKYIFMSQFQPMENGHVVATTWTGHGTKDSMKGQQLVEFDAAGKVVWKWHDAALAGSILGVIVVDDKDTTRFHPAY